MTLSILESLLEQVRNHGENYYPEEGVGVFLGVVTGEVRSVVQILPLSNTFEAEARRSRYLIDPKDMLTAENEAERRSLEVIGIFHSHPDHPARPSAYDLSWALPWYSYLITSVLGGAASENRAWRLAEDRSKFLEEKVQITQDIPQEVK